MAALVAAFFAAPLVGAQVRSSSIRTPPPGPTGITSDSSGVTEIEFTGSGTHLTHDSTGPINIDKDLTPPTNKGADLGTSTATWNLVWAEGYQVSQTGGAQRGRIGTDTTNSLLFFLADQANYGLSVRGNKAAADPGTDVVLRSQLTRTNGLLLDVQNNTSSVFSVDYKGLVSSDAGFDVGNLTLGSSGLQFSSFQGVTVASGETRLTTTDNANIFLDADNDDVDTTSLNVYKNDREPGGVNKVLVFRVGEDGSITTRGAIISVDGTQEVTGSLDVSSSVTVGSALTAGSATVSGETTVAASSGYLRFGSTSAGAPAAADCDADAERGRLAIDTTNNLLYVCNGATRAWDSVALSD